jgi:hypothetical protein
MEHATGHLLTLALVFWDLWVINARMHHGVLMEMYSSMAHRDRVLVKLNSFRSQRVSKIRKLGKHAHHPCVMKMEISLPEHAVLLSLVMRIAHPSPR